MRDDAVMKQARQRLRWARIRLLQRTWNRMRRGGRALVAFPRGRGRGFRGLTAMAGVLMIGYGAWSAYAPAGWIAAGLLLWLDMTSDALRRRG